MRKQTISCGAAEHNDLERERDKRKFSSSLCRADLLCVGLRATNSMNRFQIVVDRGEVKRYFAGDNLL